VTFSSYQSSISVDDSATLAFERLILNDATYRGYDGAARVLMAGDADPVQTVRQQVVAEVPYNVAELGRGSARVIASMNATRTLWPARSEGRQALLLVARPLKRSKVL